MAYSALTQPLCVIRRKGGRRSSTLAAINTRVLPKSTMQLPSAWSRKFDVIITGLKAVGVRPSIRFAK
jgi:hypothetical protein